VPEEVANRRTSRPSPDNTAGTTTWLDAREPGRSGDLTTEEVTGPAIPLRILHRFLTDDRAAPDYGVKPYGQRGNYCVSAGAPCRAS